jgi:hypothetical protein
VSCARTFVDESFLKLMLMRRVVSRRVSRKGARQVPLPFDPTATGASIMKGSLKAMKPRMTATLALARWRWVVIEAGVLKVYENEGVRLVCACDAFVSRTAIFYR